MSVEKTLMIIITLVIADVISGVAKAVVKKKLNSDIGVTGFTKHVLILGIVFTVHFVTKSTEYEGLSPATNLFYITFYLISVIENLKEIGIPLPPWLTKILDK